MPNTSHTPAGVALHVFSLLTGASEAFHTVRRCMGDMERRLKRLTTRVDTVDNNLGIMQEKLKSGSDTEAETMREYKKYCETSHGQKCDDLHSRVGHNHN